MRLLICSYCGNSQRWIQQNEVFGGGYDRMTQSERWPSVYLHPHCAKDLTSAFEDLFDSVHAPDNVVTRELKPVWGLR